MDKLPKDIERALAGTNARIVAQFLAGRVDDAVRGFYTDDVRYLTPDFRLLRGRGEVTAFLTELRRSFDRIQLSPVESCGDPDRGLVFQFVNAVMHPISAGTAQDAHYVAAFRRVGDDWLCEMEAPAFGNITAG